MYSVPKFHAGIGVEFLLSLFMWCKEQVKLLIQLHFSIFIDMNVKYINI